MADIQLRFNLDMLVLSTPVMPQLERIGIDSTRDNELTLLLEPEVFEEIYALEAAAGAQCIVTDTAFMTPARLAHSRMKATAQELAEAAVAIVTKHTPQHILVEIGPCGLPLDASSKDSLLENRDQYARAAKSFAVMEPVFDAYFLNGFTSIDDLRCALMGLRKETDKPVFASVDIDADGTLIGPKHESLEDAACIMAEYGAQVMGFQTNVEPKAAVEFAQRMHEAIPMLPLLVQLVVHKIDPEQNAPTPENPFYEPDTMVEAAEALAANGVQFLRATGCATPSYTGALVAATLGDNVQTFADAPNTSSANPTDLDSLAETLRLRISEALKN